MLYLREWVVHKWVDGGPRPHIVCHLSRWVLVRWRLDQDPVSRRIIFDRKRVHGVRRRQPLLGSGVFVVMQYLRNRVLHGRGEHRWARHVHAVPPGLHVRRYQRERRVRGWHILVNGYKRVHELRRRHAA